MKWNKWSVLFFTLVIMVALTACGGNSNNKNNASSTPNTNDSANNKAADNNAGTNNAGEADTPQIEAGAQLLIWDNEETEGQWARFVAEEFTKEYGIPVKVENVKHTDAPGKLQTDGPAGLGADVFLAPHDHTGNMASAGLILENFYGDEIKTEHIDAALTGGSYDGKLYGYPIAVETYGLFYNKDLVSNPPATWDELIELAKGFTDTANQKYGFMLEVGNFYYDFAFIGGYGGYVFGANNSDPSDLGLNQEGAVKAAQLMQKIHSEILPLMKEDITYDIKNSLFQEGKLMFDLNGPWAAAGYRDAGVNFGIAPLPLLDNGKNPTSFSGIKSYYVNAYSKYPEAASLYAKFAASKEMQLKRFEITSQVPTRLDLSDEPKIANDPVVSGILAQAEFAIPMPNIPEMNNVWGPMASAFTLIWNENTDPQKSLDDAVQQIKDANALISK